MLFYFLTTIVFIAELIIAFAIVLNLLKFDKTLMKYNFFLDETKPLIKDMVQTTRKLSEECLKLAPKFVEKIKLFALNMLKKQLTSLVGGITFWLVKKEVEKHV